MYICKPRVICKTTNISAGRIMKAKLILLVVTTACFLTSCGGSSPKNAPESVKEQVVVRQKQEVVPIPEDLSEEPVVELQTSMGSIKVKLYSDTPVHRDNFIKLVSEGFYNGVLFHRVIKDFMIQAGDPQSVGAPAGKLLGEGGPGYNLPAEILPNHYHKKGVLAAARQDDKINPNRESDGSQFYIVQGSVWDIIGLDLLEEEKGIKYTEEQRKAYQTVGGAPFLDAAYTVFGEVVEGLDVVDAIAAVATGTADRPISDVKIIKATIVE